MRLAHLHLTKPIPYTRSLALQNVLLEKHFRHKESLRTRDKAKGGDGVGSIGNPEVAEVDRAPHSTRSSATRSSQPLQERGRSLGGSPRTVDDQTSPSPPDPTLITFSTTPTYTVGRRHLQSNPISASQQSFLSSSSAATFHASPRGGLLTYHAPGQLTGYVVADLRRHGITPRCWVKMLEGSVMRTCAAFGVGNTARTDDPGVWIKDTDRKICAIGVQVSRGITSHGVGLNVHDLSIALEDTKDYTFTDTQRASGSYDPATKGYLSWGFSRIVACGLEGKSVTWLRREQNTTSTNADLLTDRDGRLDDPNLTSRVADVFAREVSKAIDEMKSAGKESIDGSYRIDENSI